MSLLKEISITDLSNLRIGHASDYNAQTGVTVLYFLSLIHISQERNALFTSI